MSDFFNALTTGAGSALGGLPGAIIGNVAGNVFGSIFGRSNSKSLMREQDRLQRKQQEWLLRNQYPIQVAAMRNAGLNPAFSNGSAGEVMSAPMPNATMAGNSNLENLASLAKVASDIKVNEATANNINQDTENKKVEYDMKLNESMYQLDNIITTLENRKAQSGYFRSMSALNEKKMDEVDANVKQMQAAEKELLSRRDYNVALKNFTDEQRKFYGDKVRSEIASNWAQARYMTNEDKRRGVELSKRLVELDSIIRLNESADDLNKINKEIADYTLEMDKKYENASRITRIFTDILQGVGIAVGSAVGVAMSIRGFRGPNPVKGFR